MLNKPQAVLVDARNWEQIAPKIISEIQGADLIGLDIETQDSDRHEGLNRLMKVDGEGRKGGNTKLVFDTNRTVVTGFSLYCDESDTAYYINLKHADEENRLPWNTARQLLDAKWPDATWLAHNAPYELTMMRKSLGFDMGQNVICSMQLAVSLFNADTYSIDDFATPGLGEIPKLFPAIQREFAMYEPGTPLTNEQNELFYKVVAKESVAKHSYLGYIKDICWGYGLKGLSKKFLDYTQATFDEVMQGRPHMGHLTGEEVCSYGADDAWCAVKVYHELLKFGLQENPAVIETFFTQENPMARVFSQVWGHGVNIDLDAVKERQAFEREKVAGILRTMKAAVKAMLPFPEDVHEKMVKYDEKLYGKSWQKYRTSVENWARSPDSEDDFKQLQQVKMSVSKQWAEEKDLPEPKTISITYYQVMRCILLDLCRCSFQLSDGKIQSDADARIVMKERLIKKHEEESNPRFEEIKTILESYEAIASADTTIKMFVNLYLNLTDPETGKIYPVLSSRLNSRRMALEMPNLSQLPKFGGSAYVRRFFKPDQEDHVVVSMDWAGEELVLIGEESRDPEFDKCFGQLPHGDLHSETGSALLQVSVQEFKQLPNYKQVRTEISKPANFGYWYSGALSQAGKAMGWSSEKMWEETEKYRTKYAVAEQWRTGVIQTAREEGKVVLPDHHTRIRFESTYQWAQIMRAKFAQYGEVIARFGDLVIKKIQNRSGNQSVNSLIQGGCAALAKRSILSMEEVIEAKGYDARFAYPVHDELVYSVHKSIVWPFVNDLWNVMCNHPEIVKYMRLDASAAIGRNYQAYDEKTNPKGQIELSELSKLECIPEERWGKKATQQEVEDVIAYLFEEHQVSRSEQEEAVGA